MITSTNIPYISTNLEASQSPDIRYISKDFLTFRQSSIDFCKSYFPDSYRDFNETSNGMMLIEVASYIGDILAFYLDVKFKELFLNTAAEKRNILQIAKLLGYRVQGKTPAQVYLDAYQVVPSVLSGALYVPNDDYGLIIQKGTQFTSTTKTPATFTAESNINFGRNTKQDEREHVVYEYDGSSGLPTKFLLKKVVKATAGTIETLSYSVDSPTRFLDIKITANNVIDVVDINDADGNEWYEVDYLAQEVIFKAIENTTENDPVLATDADQVPYLLKLLRVPRRFVTERDEDGYLHIRFGSGVSWNPDEELIANPWSIPLPISGSTTFVSTPIDPSNFLSTKTLGMAPFNTTLTIRYRVGGGVETNVPSNTITTVKNRSYVANSGLVASSSMEAVNSFAVNNPAPAFGGKDQETIEEIKQNASAFFAAQNRVVTREDYIVRIYSMPSKFGSIAKVFPIPAYSSLPNTPSTQFNYTPVVTQSNLPTPDSLNMGNITGSSTSRGESLFTNIGANPLAIDLYVLAYNSDRKLTVATTALKTNIKNYLNKFRILTDGVNILDSAVINIGIDFKISVSKQYNKHEILANCVKRLTEFFDISRWQINQPIIISELYKLLQEEKGVTSVGMIEIVNKYGGVYSNYVYSIKANTHNGIVYSSRIPSIFELRHPSTDIRAVSN